jgi:degradative hydroxymethylglutaryl-CoA reductase
MDKLLQRVPQLNSELLQSGGLTISKADTMIENVIGRVTLPLAIAPNFVINRKSYIVPMCIEEPSVVAASSSIAKMIAPYSFTTSSTPSIMIGQVHLPEIESAEVHLLLNNKKKIINSLNATVESLQKRGGGVEDMRIRRINEKNSVAELIVGVCEAMGANIVNTLCERFKNEITQYGIKCGIAVLTNYCTERLAMSTFEIPLKDMEWKGHEGSEVAQKVLEAYEFAKVDKHRAATHNKGILNGIDGVCLATGQDWRAVESASHVYASRSGHYQPLTRY